MPKGKKRAFLYAVLFAVPFGRRAQQREQHAIFFAEKAEQGKIENMRKAWAFLWFNGKRQTFTCIAFTDKQALTARSLECLLGIPS